jgi:hypothetical protein
MRKLMCTDHLYNRNTIWPEKLFETNKLFLPNSSMHRSIGHSIQMDKCAPGKLAKNKDGNGICAVQLRN